MTAVVLRGDARTLPLPDASVDLVVTSPPYFGLRDYRDGAASMEGQIGNETTPGEWLANLLDCTREWMRVLKPSGSIFVNLGDSYYSGKGAPGKTTTDPKNAGRNARRTTRSPLDYGLDFPRKCLLDLPHRYSIACVDELGLTKRAEICWSKPNGLPESVTDRVRRSHEFVFHLVKSPRYYAAIDEIREPHAPESLRRYSRPYCETPYDMATQSDSHAGTVDPNPLGKLPGSVWSIPSQPLTVPAHLGTDHFAAFPMELPRRCILGWSPPGICTACGEGRRPVAIVDLGRKERLTPVYTDAGVNGSGRHGKGASTLGSRGTSATITGYACACPDTTAPTRPSLVVDPFGGTGTTALVASVFGRTGISIDRSADYCRLARWRTTDPSERARAMQVPKPPPVPAGQVSLFDLDAS